MGDWHDKQTIGLLPERAARQLGRARGARLPGKALDLCRAQRPRRRRREGTASARIAPGDRVALWMVNRPEWLDAMFAIMKIGAVLVPMNTRFRTDDMAYVLGQSDAVAVILTDARVRWTTSA